MVARARVNKRVAARERLAARARQRTRARGAHRACDLEVGLEARVVHLLAGQDALQVGRPVLHRPRAAKRDPDGLRVPVVERRDRLCRQLPVDAPVAALDAALVELLQPLGGLALVRGRRARGGHLLLAQRRVLGLLDGRAPQRKRDAARGNGEHRERAAELEQRTAQVERRQLEHDALCVGSPATPQPERKRHQQRGRDDREPPRRVDGRERKHPRSALVASARVVVDEQEARDGEHDALALLTERSPQLLGARNDRRAGGGGGGAVVRGLRDELHGRARARSSSTEARQALQTCR
eukprot:1121809-Prymnesium_polylepis.1